jgi:hypothetical protein
MSIELEYLSFSRLKALSVCPRELKRYLTEKPEPSDAMNEGSLLDCLLFTPDDTERRFHFWEKQSRTTKDGKAAFAEALEKADGRILMTTEQQARAEFLADCVDRSTFVREAALLNPDHFNFQERIEFSAFGWTHKGVPDAVQIPRVTQALDEHAIWDLKKMGSHSGEWAVKSQIRAMQYDLQAAIYCFEYDLSETPCKYYIIAVSDSGYVTPVEITIEARYKARERWAKLIEIANYCKIAGLDDGPEVFAADGRFIF